MEYTKVQMENAEQDMMEGGVDESKGLPTNPRSLSMKVKVVAASVLGLLVVTGTLAAWGSKNAAAAGNVEEVQGLVALDSSPAPFAKVVSNMDCQPSDDVGKLSLQECAERCDNHFVHATGGDNSCKCAPDTCTWKADATYEVYSHEVSDCWSNAPKVYVKEGHNYNGPNCYDLEEAKQKCIEASDCHAITKQNNLCHRKYRLSHGEPTLVFWRGWHALHLSTYSLDRTCHERKVADAAKGADNNYNLIQSGQRCVNRAGMRGINRFSRNVPSVKECWQYVSGTFGCGKYFTFAKDGWCDCVAESAGLCIEAPEVDSDVYKYNRKACLDKIVNCADYEAAGVCKDSHEDHVVWRAQCVKTCGYCDDPVYTAPCLEGYCGHEATKEEDKFHLLTITKIKCIKPSGAVDDSVSKGMQALAAIGMAAAAASACVGTGGTACAATVPLLGKISGGAALAFTAMDGAATGAGAAKTALAMLDKQYSGQDDLILKVNGLELRLPCNNEGTHCVIKAGETREGARMMRGHDKTTVSFKDSATIQLVEADIHSDNDDLGWLRVDPLVTPSGSDDVIIYSEAEGSIYEISYTIELGAGDKSSVPDYVACGTVECRPCRNQACSSGVSDLDRDGDLDDLKSCPASYVHDRYLRFGQMWPFADVFLNVCKLESGRKLNEAQKQEVHL